MSFRDKAEGKEQVLINVQLRVDLPLCNPGTGKLFACGPEWDNEYQYKFPVFLKIVLIIPLFN